MLTVRSTHPQRRDKGWFDINDNLISPLTSQEEENIKAAHEITESPISDAYTAMEFYRFADSSDVFFELTSVSLAHLYFVNVQRKQAQWDHMDVAEKKTWNESQMKKVRNLKKGKLVEALVEAVRVCYNLHLSTTTDTLIEAQRRDHR
jgi:hypothetical protein